MASNAKSMGAMSVSGEWICRDNGGWRVRVPCQGGHAYFGINEYGSSQNALKKARQFHARMCKQLKKDREYFSEHGEKPERPSLNIRNRSGYTGIARHVYPNLNGRPLVVFQAYYNKNGKQISERFSLTEYKHEEYALKAAVKWREEMMKRR